MKASEWEIEDAEREGIPILDNHAPKEVVIRDGKVRSVIFEKMRAEFAPDGTGWGFGGIGGAEHFPNLAHGFHAFINDGDAFFGAGLFAFTGLIHLTLAGFVTLRRRRSVPVAPDRHTEFSDALTAAHTASSVYEEEVGAEEIERRRAG